MQFVKMHGIGNDYVFIDNFRQEIPQDLSALAIAVAKPHFGIGSDGLIVISPSGNADARMRIFNADGSEAQICGNGLRCTGKYLFDHGLVKKTEMRIETLAGVKPLALYIDQGEVDSVCVDMGQPDIRRGRVSVDAAGETLDYTCVSMGNPHAVTFDRWPDDRLFYALGPAVERHVLFPERTNVEFARVDEHGRLIVRVWERGSGETLACGSGACASLVAAVLNGVSGRKAQVVLPGGELTIEWRASDGKVYMTGSATTVFEGTWR